MKKSCKISFAFIAIIFLFPALLLAGQYKVVRIVDGDTVVINFNGKHEKVRLLCVDTPESVHRDRKQNIPMGKVASDYAKRRLEGKRIDLEFEGPRRGYYGRLLAYIYVDGKNFNLELVRQGLSPYYTKYGLSEKHDQVFRYAERQARKDKLNIWGDAELTKKYLNLKSKWGQHESKRAETMDERTIQADTGDYIGSKKSRKFHRPDCRYAKKILNKNRAYFKSRKEALDRGYMPCKVCKP